MRFLTLSTALLITLITIPVHSRSSDDAEHYGVVIVDEKPYASYQYSKVIEYKGTTALIFNDDKQDLKTTIERLLKAAAIPYKLVSASPLLFQTDWVAWHYDAETKKALSQQENFWFTLNTRDKYKFRISATNIEQHPAIIFDKVNREKQIDITPDSTMVWLKWKQKKPNAEAVKTFMQRLQTEHEALALERSNTASTPALVQSHVPQIVVVPVSKVGVSVSNVEVSVSKEVPVVAKPLPITKKIGSNTTTLNLNVEQTWALLIRRITNKNISLIDTHNDQHMLNTDWIYADYDTTNNTLSMAVDSNQRHQFQVIVVPGSTEQFSSVFVYHTKFQKNVPQHNSDEKSWSDSKTQQEIAAAFLEMLDLNP
jgi:hypothetical protein